MSDPVRHRQTHRVAVTGAELHVEVRGHGSTILLFGCPMDAEAFETLADELADAFRVITTDPRGIKRSAVADRDRDVTPEQLADDLSVIIDHLGAGPATVFGSSGGAVASLALIQQHNIADWVNGRTEPQDLADEHFFFAHTLRTATYWRPDIPTLATHAPHITIGVGSESAGQICDRTTTALATAIGITPTEFTGGHTGFVDHPALFARQLKAILREL